MDSATRCSNIIKQVNDHAHGGGLLTSDIGLENGATSRSFCFCMDRLWAWMKGVSYDKNEVAKSINTAFQGVNLSHLNVSEAELQIFSQNLEKLSRKFTNGSKFNQGLGGTISKVGLHVLIGKPTKQGLPLPKDIPPKTTVTTGHMDGASAARSNLRGPTLISSPPRHTSFPSVRTPLLSQPVVKPPVYVKGVGPTGLRGIPNYSSNCFAISAYQMVKSNPSLYDAIFNAPSFKLDKRFDALREFDAKYDSGIQLTRADMQKVRTECLTQFHIPSHGHQDAYEVLTLALFEHLPPTSAIRSTAIYEFTVAPDRVDDALHGMNGVQEIDRTLRPGTGPFSSDQVTVRVRKNFETEPVSSLPITLDRVSSGASLEEAIAHDLSEGRGDTFRLSPTVVGRQTEKQVTFTAGREVTIALKRFDNYGNKISKQVSVPNGRVQLGEGGPHTVKGFIVHLGPTRRYGHYVEYQKVGDQWYLNNDPRSEPVLTAVALNAMRDAYVLYAERA